MKKIPLVLTLAAGLLAALTFSTRAQNVASNNLFPEELALFKEGAVMETYNPDKPRGHEIIYIQPLGANHKPKGPKSKMLAINFGIEDAKAAREEGISMAQFITARHKLMILFLRKAGASINPTAFSPAPTSKKRKRL